MLQLARLSDSGRGMVRTGLETANRLVFAFGFVTFGDDGRDVAACCRVTTVLSHVGEVLCVMDRGFERRN